jgi:hypothetical protein
VSRFLFGSQNQHNSQLFFGPIRADCTAARPIYFIFQKKHLLGYYITSIEVAVVHRIRLKTTQHPGNGMCPSPGEDGRDRIFFGGP